MHSNPWYRVRQDRVLTPEGKKGIYNVIEKPPSAITIALNTRGEIALIKLFRYPTQMSSIEIPNGSIEPGESPLRAAKRELNEETGLRAKTWKKLGVLQGCPGFSNSLYHVFLATNLTQTSSHRREEEGIESVTFAPFRTVLRMIQDGRITDNATVGPILLAALHLKKIR